MTEGAPEPISFRDAIDRTKDKRRHLLLGNGFSIAASKKFKYDFLSNEAGRRDEAVGRLFESFVTHDFEVVMQRLRDRRDRALAEGDSQRAAKVGDLIWRVREALLLTVFDVHPEHTRSLDERYESARDFLRHFIGREGHARPGGVVFTTNYDTLLIWLVAKFQTVRATHGELRFHDAFAHGIWREDEMHHVRLSLVYLHGALPLYNRGGHVHRITYNNDGPIRTLRDQIRERLKDNELPLFVSEGTCDEKKARIRADPYLAAAFKKFGYACKEAKTVLFTYGHSLDPRDDHLCEAIGQGGVDEVFLGVYGAVADNSAELARIASRLHELRRPKAGRRPLRLFAYNTERLGVWDRRSDVAA